MLNLQLADYLKTQFFLGAFDRQKSGTAELTDSRKKSREKNNNCAFLKHSTINKEPSEGAVRLAGQDGDAASVCKSDASRVKQDSLHLYIRGIQCSCRSVVI